MLFRSSRPISVDREYPSAPLVGVAAAVFNHQGQVLLVKRGRQPAKGSWGLPGGLLDLGERLEDGVRREVREETAIEIDIGGLVAAIEPLEFDDDDRIRYHYVVLDYWARHISGIPHAQDDAEEAAWVNLAAMDGLRMSDETRRVIRLAHQQWQR